MPHIKRGVPAHARHKKILALAKGYRGRAKNNFRIAIERVEKGLQYAYRDRRAQKRQFRRLWTVRINAGARALGVTYSQFINGLHKAGVKLDRKVISGMAISEPEAFKALVDQAQAALSKAASKPASKTT